MLFKVENLVDHIESGMLRNIHAMFQLPRVSQLYKGLLLNSVHTHTHKTSIIVYDLPETVDNSSGRR